MLMQAAFPNYHPEPAMLDVLLQFLQDLPGDVLKVAVLEACAQPGRSFAPAVGEIRQAALKLSARARAVPNEFEAWAEVLPDAEGLPAKHHRAGPGWPHGRRSARPGRHCEETGWPGRTRWWSARSG